jgi:hypothetical protein
MATQNREGRAARTARPDPVPAPAPEAEQSEPEPEPAPDKVRPVHVERIGHVRAAIWANDGGPSGVYYVVTASRIYKDGENQWRSTDRFGRDDLLVLAKVLDRAHTWICDTLQAPAPPL